MIYMFLKDGFEETEALATLDMIRRANIDIKTVSDSDFVTGTHDIKVIPDISFNEIMYDNMDGVILPGGQPGADNLYKDERVIKAVKYCFDNNLMIGAICAAPYILGKLGMLKGKKATAFPDFQKYLEGADVTDNKVTRDENIITAKGMGASFLFGAEIIKYKKDERTAQNILQSIFAN